MADLTVSTDRLIRIWKGCLGVDELSPPMAVKARYVIAKAMGHMEDLVKKHDKAHDALARSCAKRDDKGKLIRQGGGFAIDPDAVDTYTEELQKLLDVEVVLPGVRLITRAEIGACPITQMTERHLLGFLIEDVEPA